VITSFDDSGDSALGRFFERQARDVAWFSLAGGAPLFLEGEAADQLYLVRAGLLAAGHFARGAPAQILGLIGPGEVAGEMSLIAGTAHTSDVIALRDSEVLALPRAIVVQEARTDAALMFELARLALSRARSPAHEGELIAPRVFGFIGASSGAKVRTLAEQVAGAVRRHGYAVTVIGAEAQDRPTEWFSNVEHMHDYVLYAAESHEAAWKLFAERQVDRLVQVALGKDPPPEDTARANQARQLEKPIDLVLVQGRDCAAPVGSSAWSEAIAPGRLFQLRAFDPGDTERIARAVTGQAVGLVLSGGAARAYAHVGAIQALRQANAPIDFVGGVSMGAVIGAGVAMGWDMAELDRRIRKAFVESSPVDDVALPIIAMTRGAKVRERLAEHFGDRQICDLWLPFFCGSANLTTGAYQIHRQGLVREAALASLSLPGVLPPVTWGNDVLVDGAVMNNFPADVMRSLHAGPIVGVDVGRGRSIEARDVVRPSSIWRWLLSGQWRNGPPIVSLLMRAATVTAGRDLAAARQATDVLILPEVDDIEIRDWKAYDPAVREGHKATVAALAALRGPISEMRRRPAMDTPSGALGSRRQSTATGLGMARSG